MAMDMDKWEGHSRQYRSLKRKETQKHVRSTLIALMAVVVLFVAAITYLV